MNRLILINMLFFVKLRFIPIISRERDGVTLEEMSYFQVEKLINE